MHLSKNRSCFVRVSALYNCHRAHRFNYLSSSSRHILDVFEDVITEDEEKVLIDFLNPVLSRKKYEGNHWDDVILKYKELDLAPYLRTNASLPMISESSGYQVNSILKKLQDLISISLNDKNIKYQSPHVIDLAKEGYIGAHIDSVKFSGDFICGLSLLSCREMILTKEISNKLDHQNSPCTEAFLSSYPSEKKLKLNPRSLYILSGVWRYHFNHSILGEKHYKNEESNIKIDRRISIIFRNEV